MLGSFRLTTPVLHSLSSPCSCPTPILSPIRDCLLALHPPLCPLLLPLAPRAQSRSRPQHRCETLARLSRRCTYRLRNRRHRHLAHPPPTIPLPLPGCHTSVSPRSQLLQRVRLLLRQTMARQPQSLVPPPSTCSGHSSVHPLPLLLLSTLRRLHRTTRRCLPERKPRIHLKLVDGCACVCESNYVS